MTDWSALIAQKKQAIDSGTKRPETDWSALIVDAKKKAGTKFIEPFEKDRPKRENIATVGPAPFEAHEVAAASGDPKQKIRAFAKHRFPTLSTDEAEKRYYMKDGEIWYIDNDGYERKEDTETGLKRAIEQIDPTEIKGKQFLATGLLEAPPAIVGSGVGYATASPTLGALAAGATRSVESLVANVLADRDPQYKEAMIAGGTEAAAGIVGDFIAKKGIQAFDGLRNAIATGDTKMIQKIVGEDIPGLKLPESQAAIKEIARIAEENDISLDMAQLLQSQEAAALQKSILQSGGAGAEILKQQGKETAESTYDALTRQIEGIAPDMKSRYAVGKEVVETAEAARESLVSARKEASGELYKEAFKEQKPVEVLPVVNSIDKAIKNDLARGGKTAKQLHAELKDFIKKLETMNDPDRLKCPRPHGIESHQDTVTRFIRILRQISIVHIGQAVLVGTHGGVMKYFLIHLGYGTYQSLDWGSIDNCAHIKLLCDGIDFFIKETHGVSKKES